MSHPNVVVAGAAGDLGGRLVRALVVAGARVSALVSLELPTRERSRLESGVTGYAAA